MSPMLKNDLANRPPRQLGARALMVGCSRFTNSAAKFWSALIDELASDHPTCNSIAFNLLTDIMLERDLLFPEHALQRELSQRKGRFNIEETLQETLAQFELFGPPGAVQVRLYADGLEKSTSALPLDCVDTDIFPCLLVWLLEWSEMPWSLWNNASVNGGFVASDKERALCYHLRFQLANQHLSEGLHQRALTLCYARHQCGARKVGDIPIGPDYSSCSVTARHQNSLFQ